ncbi:hypothetical protein, partial [Paenibacillus sp. MSJ-34]|uniref:hypothetical protein n=1 Tax=Paenibacillus sp. MSJ-34 TaxID=2841529 RepID=UPI001C1084C3
MKLDKQIKQTIGKNCANYINGKPKFRKPVISNTEYSGSASRTVKKWRFPSSFGSSQHYVDTL